MMKKLMMLLSFSAYTLVSFAQADTSSTNSNRKYVLWFSPSNATQVDGINFSFFPKEQGPYPTINGMEIDLNPIGLFSPLMTLVHSIDKDVHRPITTNIDTINFATFKKINGLQVAMLNMEPTMINGVNINLTGNFTSVVNGITLSLILNKHYKVNGLTAAVIGNHDTVCNGLQIGIYNSCKKLRGIQLGLWNKNEKRFLPILNWNFD